MNALSPAVLDHPAASTLDDAVLLAACAEHARVTAALNDYCDRFPGDIPDTDVVADVLLKAQAAAAGRVATIRAITDTGHMARARAIASLVKPGFFQRDDPDDASMDRLQAALVRDMVAAAHAEEAKVLIPAALTACQAFDELGART